MTINIHKEALKLSRQYGVFPVAVTEAIMSRGMEIMAEHAAKLVHEKRLDLAKAHRQNGHCDGKNSGTLPQLNGKE